MKFSNNGLSSFREFVIKPGAPACGHRMPGFLELVLSANVCVCVPAPKAINN